MKTLTKSHILCGGKQFLHNINKCEVMKLIIIFYIENNITLKFIVNLIMAQRGRNVFLVQKNKRFLVIEFVVYTFINTWRNY